MQHGAPRNFWKLYKELPVEIRKKAKKQYRLLRKNPYHPSLHFKNVHIKKCLWSARVDISYRAVALQKDDKFIWFWIGTHREYEKLIK